MYINFSYTSFCGICSLLIFLFKITISKIRAICKPRHWNLGIGIGIGTGIGTDITNAIISSSIRPMDPNLSRVVTQDEGTPPTKSRDTLIWGHVTKKKRYISTFTRPVDSKLSRVVTQYDGISPTKSRDTSTTWSRDKSETLYLHFH